MAFVTQNSRLSAAEQRLGPQGGRGTFTRRNINNDPRAASGRSGREQDENPSRGTAPTIFQGVTTVQANRNRSSRLIDVGGEPIGQLRVTPANPPTSETPPPRNYTITRVEDKEITHPLVNRVSRITIPQEASRLRSLHVEDGFLDAYYAQLTSDGILGMRNVTPTATKVLGFSAVIKPKLRTLNSIGRNLNIATKFLGVKTKFNTDTSLSFNVPPDRPQPFVIRGIGKRWGIDRVEKPGSALSAIGGLVQIDRASHKGRDLVDSYFNVIDDVGKRIIGRTPSVFLDRYFADVKRINAATNGLDFLVRGSTFVNAQSNLQKRNPFESVSSTLYKISDEHQYKITFDTFMPDKIGGIPIKGQLKDLNKGATFNLNPQAYNPLSLFSVPGVLGINRSAYLDVGGIVAKGTLADYVTDKVLDKIVKVGTEYVKDKGKEYAKNWLKKKTVKDFIRQSNEKLADAVDTAESYIDTGKKVAEYARKTAKYFDLIPTVGPISKAALNKVNVNLSAYDDIGKDKVNLIPYGVDYYTKDGKGGSQKVPLEELDWIPFKFKDVRNKKDIVFRAILSGITDTFSPEYASERYVGRPDKVHVYQGTDREITFTFDVYPKSMEELPVLWKKLNYLAGQTYPHWTDAADTGVRGMVSPYTELTIGQMFTDTPGYISALTYTIMDEGTWETLTMKLPKYVQVNCTFVYIGDRLPSAEQKHYELPWVAEKRYPTPIISAETISEGLKGAFGLAKGLGIGSGKIKPLEVDIGTMQLNKLKQGTLGDSAPTVLSNFGKKKNPFGFPPFTGFK